MKWKKFWIAIWTLTLLAIFVVTLISNKPYFLMGGSSSVAPVMQELINQYPDNHKAGDFNYISSASSGAPPRVESGLFGTGWLSEKYNVSDDDPNIFTFVMMTDGLVIFYNVPTDDLVNPTQPLDFNTTNVQDLYLHGATWGTAFPGQFKKDIPVQLFTRPNGSGTRSVFDQKVLGNETFYKANTLDSSSAMLNLDSGGIGYGSFSDLNQADASKITSEAGNWNSVKASIETIKNGNYTLSRPFTGLINRNYKHADAIKGILKWVFSDDSNVIAIFNKYGPRKELSDHDNEKLQEWLSETN